MILGGSSKKADFSDLATVIRTNKVGAVILIGLEGKRIGEALNHVGYSGVVSDQPTLIEAVGEAKKIAKIGDIVIFSPACASFDMFKDYKQRGAKFAEAVNNLK